MIVLSSGLATGWETGPGRPPTSTVGISREGAPQAAATSQHPRGLPPGDGRFFFVGSETCRACHRQLFESWQTSRHARSGSKLDFEQQLDAECRPCHLPGDDAFEEFVGCEACHGAASAYAELDVMIDPLKRRAAGLTDPTERCVYCHNPGHPFHVERDLEAAAGRIHPPSPLR